ncbi:MULTISPECIES: phage tail protein [Glaesserella]|uniref:Phage tail protein n=1 Tax=Glaesserella australis TaxID=2094024 RepID=A0A328BWD6_9PAST|nr:MULTISPECIES: phage tail protein [Glaesserella]AUI65211.1 phage tail protein [Glaesserella sp. 15-184]RAL18483.1 phage tail protein [Glaesserella australis]
MSEYVGAIVLEVDSLEIEVTKCDPKVNTGRKGVKTFNSSGRMKGFIQGIAEYTLSITAVKPKTEDGTIIDVDWENLTNAKITIYPLGDESNRTTYQGCFSTEVGESYTVDNEAVIDIQLGALRKVIE